MTKSKRFTELSLQEQKALFERAAAEVLPQWQIDDYSIGWISYSTNAVFHVKMASGPYILRLHVPGRVAEDRLRSELMWLRAIRQGTNLLAPLPVPLSDGRLFISYSPPMLPSASQVHCVLFERLKGEIKPARALSVEDVRRIGVYLGILHRDAQFDPPADFDRHRLDFEALFDADSPYYVARESELLTREQSRIFQAVAGRIRQMMTCLDHDGESFGLIHADLLAKNVIFADASVAALDFEYCCWGYFLYDLAPLLWELKGERSANYIELEEALWTSYISARAEADDQRDRLETFIAARQLLSCRWLLQNIRHPNVREVAPRLLQARVEELKGYLAIGVLQRRTATL